MIAVKALALLLLPLTALSDTWPLEERSDTSCTPTLRKHRSSQLHCDDTGLVLRPEIISQSMQPTQEACRDSCLVMKSCVSFSYNTGDNQCVLNAKTIAGSRFTELPVGASFWNRHCYSCKCQKGLSKCGKGYSANCFDFLSDPRNCGGCGIQVGDGQGCCGGYPSDLNTFYNCGSCGNYIGYMNTCCGTTGADTNNDPNNCGGCGNICDSGVCKNGRCGAPQVILNPSFEINDNTTPANWSLDGFVLQKFYDQAYSGDFYLSYTGGTNDGSARAIQTFKNPYDAGASLDYVLDIAVGGNFNAPQGSFTVTVTADGVTLLPQQSTCNTDEDYYCYTVQGGNVPDGGWRRAAQSGTIAGGLSETPTIVITFNDQGLTDTMSLLDKIELTLALSQ